MDDLEYCINYLKEINNINYDTNLNKEDILRALMNITYPINLDDEYYIHQDRYLKNRLSNKKIIDVNDLEEIEPNIILYKGDITLIKADAIVNAGNNKLLGCFIPLHNCIDNAIHSFSGLEVRRDLIEIMNKQNKDEDNGKCKATKAYNLPSSFIFHTVGPNIVNKLSKKDIDDLKNCYISCLEEARRLNLKSIVFPSISTGLFSFPISKASSIAIGTVKEYLNKTNYQIKVVFDLFKEEDYEVYYKTLK